MDTEDADPFAEQQQLFELLSQDTRQLIVQELLGHPAHLMSLAELEYMTGKNRVTITNHLDTLRDGDIIAQYIFEPNKETRGLPAQFYGFTERGVEILHNYNTSEGFQLLEPSMRTPGKRRRSSATKRRHVRTCRPLLRKHSSLTSQISTTSMSMRVDKLSPI